MFTLVSAFLSKTSEDSSFLVKGRSSPRWSGRWCWDTRHLGVSLLMERYSLTRGRLLPPKKASWRNRRRSVPRGLVSFPWQPSQCLIKLSPCPPPCSSVSTFSSLQLSPAIPLVHPRSDETTEEGLERGYKAVGHFLFRF